MRGWFLCGLLLVALTGCSSTSPTRGTTSKANYALRGKLRFFEGPKSPPAKKGRRYRTTFGPSARYIHSELELTNHLYGIRDQWLTFKRSYYGPNGKLIRAVTTTDKIDRRWRTSYGSGGVGYLRGRWRSGRHRVVVSVNGRYLTQAWFTITGRSPPARRTSPAPRRGYALNELRLFESGYGVQPRKQRRYTTVFPSRSTRYINWELVLDNRRRYRGKQSIALRLDYYRGAVKVASSSMTGRMESNWGQAFYSKGYGTDRAGGFWTPGTYKAVLFADGVRLATRFFTVTGAPRYAPKPTRSAPEPVAPTKSYTTRIVFAPADGLVGRHYSQRATYTSNFVRVPSWAVVSGALPPGLSLDAKQGTISGTPRQGGSWRFTLGLRDRYRGTHSQRPGQTGHYLRDVTIRIRAPGPTAPPPVGGDGERSSTEGG